MSIFGFVPVPRSDRPANDDQPSFGWDLNRDLRTVSEMSERLVPYVYEDELYGTMPGDLAKLTVGGLLMRLSRLQGLKDTLTADQQAQVEAAQARLDSARKEWAVHYEGKMTREAKARMQTVENFLNDCVENQKLCAENYASQMEKRVILDALATESQRINFPIEVLDERLQRLDNAIRRFVEKGTFRWDARLEKVYDADRFWYLYAFVPKPGQAKPIV